MDDKQKVYCNLVGPVRGAGHIGLQVFERPFLIFPCQGVVFALLVTEGFAIFGTWMKYRLEPSENPRRIVHRCDRGWFAPISPPWFWMASM